MVKFPHNMSKNNSEPLKKLIWLEIEHSVSHTNAHRISRMASLVTNSELVVLGEGPQFTWVPGNVALAKEIERETLLFLRHHVKRGASPLCGNNPCEMRRWLFSHMPKLDQFFHYRFIEMDSIREVVEKWTPRLNKPVAGHRPQGSLMHRLHQLLDELRYYKKHVFVAGKSASSV